MSKLIQYGYMINRGRSPAEVNERISAEVFAAEERLRKVFLEETYLLLLDSLEQDVEVSTAYFKGEIDSIEIFTQSGHLDGYMRGDQFQKAVSLMLMREGEQDEDEMLDGNERLRVLFPVNEEFAHKPEDLDALLSVDEPLEMFTEWVFWQDGERRTIRWVISEEKMVRYTSVGDTSEQVDEIDDFEASFARLEGRQLASRGDVLNRIIQDFVNFRIRPQKRMSRENKTATISSTD